MNFKVYLLLFIAFISGLAAKAANTAPTFVGGANQSFITCPGTASTIDSFLITNDPDVGQSMTWAIFKAPLHGTLHGFSGSGTSNGGTIAPSGFSYNSANGYTGIDSFVLSVNDGFATTYTKVSVFIQAGPTLSPISGNTALCVGNTSQLTDTAKGGTWSSSNTAVARVSTGGLVTAVAAGSATISYSATGASGCTSVATAAVTVYAIPTVANITGTNTVCVGATTQFSDNTAGGVWSSSNTNNATVDQNGLVNGVTGSNGGNTATISYTVTNGSTCSTAVTRNVTVYSIPTINPITGNTSVCTGNTTTLTVQNGNNGTWSSLNTAIAVVSANGGVVTGVSVGIDTIRYTSTNGRGCSNYVDTVVTVSTAPTVAAISGSSNRVCVGKTLTLTDATAGGIWTSSNVAQAKVDSLTGLVNGVSAGAPQIRYTVTNAGGCSTTVNYTITVNNNPTVASIAGATTTCVNTSTLLTDNTAAGVWSSLHTNIATVDATGNVTGVAAGADTIAYTVTSAAGCITASTFPISIVTGIPVKPIYGVNVLCSGNSTTLQDSTAGGTWTSSDNGIAFPVGSTIYAGSGGNAVITYTVSGGTGCSGSATFNFTVIQVPTVPAITGNSQVCIGSSIQLSNTVSGGFWTSSNTSLATVDQTGLVKGLSAGGVVISYTVTGNGGCTQTSTANINVNALPTVKHIVGSNSTCVGATSIYTDSTAGGVWKSSNTAVATISVNGIFQTKTAGTTLVTYTLTNGNGCSVVDSISVDVNQFLVVSPITGTNTVCQTQTTTLTDSTTGGTWISRNTAIATLTTTNNIATVTGVAAGTTYIIDSISNGGCIGKDSILLTVNARPNAPGNIGGLPNGGLGLCAGSTNQFTDQTAGGVWSSSNTSYATIVANTGLATGISGGTTTISYTVSNAAGCTRASTYSLSVNAVNPLTTAIQGNSTVCAGSNSTYTDASTGGTWASSNTAIATITSGGVLTAIAAGNVTIEYSVAGGGGPNPCPRSTSKTITINPLPAVTPIIGNTSLCANGFMLLTDNTGGGTWTSFKTTIANIDANGIVSGVAAGKDTIAYTVTDGTTGCSNVAYSLISVNALPVISPITGTKSICIGKTSQLADATAGGTWSTSNNSITSISAGGLVNGLSVGVDSVYYKVTNANKCSDSVFTAFTVNGLPTVAAITGASPLCVGTNETLTSSPVGGTWISTNTAVATISASGFVQALTAGTTTIKYIVTNGSGCTDSVSTVLTVNPLPVIGKISGTTSICLGKTTILSDTTAGGNLFNANPSVATYTTINSASVQVTGVSVGSDKFTYVVTNVYGCVDSVSATVLVNALPTIAQINGATTACVGKTAQLTNATPGGTWVSANKAIATVSATGLVTGVKAGTDTIRYIVTNIAGCTDSVYTVVTINPLPVIGAITGATSVCVNATLQLADTSLNGTWSAANNFATINNSGLVTGQAAGTGVVRYTVTNIYGCVDSVSANFTVNALPVIASITGSNAVCVGKTTQLSETTTGGIWKSVTPAVATIDVNGLVTAVKAGSSVIRYTVTNGNGCTDSVSTTVTVNALPVIAAIGGNTTVCVRNSTQLTETTTGGNWKSVSSNIAFVNSLGLVAGLSAGTSIIRYTVTNSNGCVDSVATTVTVNALPVIISIGNTSSTICVGKTTQLTELTTGGTWKSATPSIATIDVNGLVTGLKAGTDSIRYIVTNGNGCIDSVSTAVKVNALPAFSAIAGTTSFCMGKTSQLTDTATGGTWTSISPNVATVNTSGLVSTVAVGTSIIRYTITNANGCTDSVSATVTVNALPVIAAIGGTTTICAGKTTQLTETTTGGTWKSVTPAAATVNATGLVTAVAAGSSVIRYIVTNGSGCTDSVSTTVTVNALPVFTAIAGTTTICAGKTTQLTETTTGGSWTSITPSVATVDVNGLVTAVKAGSSIIRYTVTNGNGCTDSVSATVTVNALPVIAVIGGTTTICAGKTTQLTETTTGGTWKSISTNAATVNAAGLVTGVAAGSSIIRYTVTNVSGCTDSVSTTVTVNALPVIAAISGTTTICAGKTTQLIETTTGGTWTSVTPSVATIDVNGLVTAVKAGSSIIRYTVTNVSGCTDSVSTTVIVNALPVLSAIAGTTSICMGKTTQLSDTATGGTWTSISPNVATVNTSGLVSTVAVGTSIIRYTITNANGCTDSVSTTVTVNALPVIAAISGTTTICAGKTTQLTETTTGGTWKSVTPSAATVNASGLVTAVAAGSSIIRYSVTNVSGCTDSVSTTVTVNALPVFTAITGTTTICAGKTTQLTETTNGGTWTSITPSVATVDVNGLVTAVKAGSSIIRYTVTNGNGCTDSVSATVTVNALPVIAAIGGTTSICAGKTTQLTETTTGGTWKSISTNAATVNASGLVTGVAAGSSIIRYTVTNGSGCTDSVSTTVTVNALPVIAAISGTTTICAGKTTQLIETTTGGTWTSVTPSVATIDVNGLVTAVKAGSSIIRYTVTNGSGCTDSVSTSVIVNALPVLSPISGATSFCVNKSNTLSDTALGGTWSSSNTILASINATGIVTASAPGIVTITYTLTNGNGCTSSVSVIDTINAVPTVSAITGNSSVCAGNSITLAATTNGTGVWSSVSPFTATVGAATGIVTAGNFPGGTTIKYVVSNTFGCQDSVSKVITVNANPVVAAITGAAATCVGSSLNLSSTTTGGKWTLTNNSIASIDSVSGKVNALAAGTDTVVYAVTNGSGCTTTVNTSFVINLMPAITAIGSNSPVNQGDTLFLTSVSSVPAAVYSWTGPNGFTASTAAPFIANTVAANAGTYYVSANNNGCISPLDSATVVINVSYYVSGNIISPKGLAVNQASVNVTGSATKSATTDATGSYSVLLGSGPNTSYVIAPYKNNDSVKATGVTVTDVALIQAHILQKSLLSSPYKILAADVNGDSKVTTLDIVFMKRLILGIDTTFTNTNSKVNRLWGFVDSAYTFPDPTAPFPAKSADTIVGLSGNTTGKSFVGFKLGDVNWDWKRGAKTTPVEFYYNPAIVDDNGIVKVPVRVKNFKSMIGMQFTLNYNKEVFDFVSVNKNQLNMEIANHANNGSLSFVWNDPNNEMNTLNEDAVLFELVLSKKAYFESEDFTIDSRITATEAIDGNFDTHELIKTAGQILNKPASSTVVSEYVHVGPNPNNGKFNVEIAAVQNKSVKLSVMDLNGRILSIQRVELIAGKNTIPVDITRQIKGSTGNYFLKVEDGTISNSYKILINP